MTWNGIIWFFFVSCLPHPRDVPKELGLPAQNSNLANGWGFMNICWVSCYCSITQSCPAICNPMDCSTPDFPVLHRLLEFVQTHVHWVGDASQPSHPLSPPSSPALNLHQHQGLFQWVGSSDQVVKILELLLQRQVLPVNIQGWFPFELTGLMSLLSKGLSSRESK